MKHERSRRSPSPDKPTSRPHKEEGIMRRKTRKFIYIVEVWYDYEALDIMGAFESEEEAQKAVDYYNRQPDVLHGASINYVTVYSSNEFMSDVERVNEMFGVEE